MGNWTGAAGGAWDGYEALIMALEDELAVPVGLWHTGGGCMALGAELKVESYTFGVELLITEANETLHSWDDRQARLAKGHRVGYTVGVYAGPDGYGSDATAMARGVNTESPEGVVALVRAALTEAGKRGFTAREGYFEPIDLEVV